MSYLELFMTLELGNDLGLNELVLFFDEVT